MMTFREWLVYNGYMPASVRKSIENINRVLKVFTPADIIRYTDEKIIRGLLENELCKDEGRMVERYITSINRYKRYVTFVIDGLLQGKRAECEFIPKPCRQCLYYDNDNPKDNHKTCTNPNSAFYSYRRNQDVPCLCDGFYPKKLNK